MKSSSSAADRRHCRCGGCGAAGRRTLLIERYVSRRHGHGAGVTISAADANVHGEMHRVVQVSRPISWRVSIVSAGSTRRILSGKDSGAGLRHRAYKIAADDLLLNQKVDILFHALGAAW